MVWGKILPWTNQFETNQLPKRIMKNSRRTWCVRIRKSEFWLSKFLYVYLDAFTNNFPGSHKRSSTPDSCASYRGNHSEPLDRWRTHPPPSVAIEVISWRRTCLPIANELGKEPARWKPPWYIMVQWYSNSTLHLSWCSLDGYYQLHDSWCETSDWGVKSVEQISVSCIFHSDTVPHALPRFHNPFSSVLVQFEKATVQPRTLCRVSSSWTWRLNAKTVHHAMYWHHVIQCDRGRVILSHVRMSLGVCWHYSRSFLGSNCAIVPALGCPR